MMAALLLLGALLLVAALYQSDSSEPPGWVAMNSQVKEVLNPADNEPGPAAKDKIKNDAFGGDRQSGGMTVPASIDAEQEGAASSTDVAEDTKTSGGSKTKEGTGAGSEDEASDSGKETDAKQAASVGEGGEKAIEPRGAGLTEEGKININFATAQELDELPGIGEAKAGTIVADREKNGPFRSVDDLLRVKGIGPKLLEKMKPSIVVAP